MKDRQLGIKYKAMEYESDLEFAKGILTLIQPTVKTYIDVLESVNIEFNHEERTATALFNLTDGITKEEVNKRAGR